jgi:truncated hemoglobin YjbI
MSKYDMHQKVWEQCGVSYEDSQRALALEPSLFDRLGTDGIRRLSVLFYERVYNDRIAAPWFVNIFASSTKQGAIDNQYRFLVQTFGGPDLYRQVKGKYTRLVGRHAAFTTINHAAASRWMHHMRDAMKEHEVLNKDEEALDALEKYFRFTAHYIVVASEFMRPDQVGPQSVCIRCAMSNDTVCNGPCRPPTFAEIGHTLLRTRADPLALLA